MARSAGVPEWPKGAGCKPAGSAFGGSNPPPCIASPWATVSNHALLAQSVEHLHGKEGVDGSSPSEGSSRSRMVSGNAGAAVVGQPVGCPVMEPFWNRGGLLTRAEAHLSSSSSASNVTIACEASGEPSLPIAADYSRWTISSVGSKTFPTSSRSASVLYPPRAIGCARNDLQLGDHSKGGDEP